MYRKLFTILFLFGFTVLLTAQKPITQKEKMINYTEKDVNSSYYNVAQKPAALFPVKNNPNGDTVGQTKFGVIANAVIRQQVKYYGGKPHILGVVIPNSKGNRSVTYFTPDNGSYAAYEVPSSTASTNRTGWGALDVALTGSNIGTLGIVAHTPNTLYLWDPGTKTFASSVFQANTDPSIAMVGDNVYLAESGNRDSTTGYRFWKTTDYGVTFTQFDKIKNYHPVPVEVHAQASTEVDLFKSANEKYIGYVGGQKYVATSDPDSYNNAWLFNSTDAGATWKARTIGTRDSLGIISNYPDGGKSTLVDFYWGQNQGAVSNDGVFHVVSNGFGLDTLRRSMYNSDQAVGIYPVIYWNSKLNIWKSISDYNIDTMQTMRYQGRIGNGMGQCWPSISTSEDGKVVFCVWQGPQMTNGKPDITTNVISDQYDTATSDYITDLYYAYSLNGGTTFAPAQVLSGANKKEFAEMTPSCDRILEKVSDGYRVHMTYLEQVAPFGQTPTDDAAAIASNLPLHSIIYRTFKIVTTGVENETTPVASFDLAQNYPNPFNPNTTIKYSIPSANKVSLRVYDVLGKEVASLVNDVKPAGTYEVNFDASKLASGMYIYSVTAGNYSASKKMMLLK